MRFAAYDTDKVDPLAFEIGRFTFHRDVKQADTISTANNPGLGKVLGRKATSIEPPAMIAAAT
jgi:hypothetical protein